MSAASERVGASIEISPRQAAQSADLPGLFPAATRVYIADLGAENEALVLAGARRLTDFGYAAVPHIAVRRCGTRAQLERRVQALTQEGGVRDFLVIGGDLKDPAGPFSCSMEVLETGIFDRCGVTDIGIAGHPEGNPNSPEASAFETLRLKYEFSKRTDAQLRIVTQFGFDSRSLISWSHEVASQGVSLPVHAGVAGPANMTTLLKYSAICGVGNSLSFVRKRAKALTALASGYSPEKIVDPIEKHALGNGNANVKQIHVFAFGGIKAASQWLRRRGTWNG